MPSDDPLLVDRPAPGLAVLTLNRPAAMNALSRHLRRSLVAAIDALEHAGDVRVLILTGAGRAFCAGLDLKEAGEAEGVLANVRDDDPVARLHGFAGVTIGAINGAAVTGGFELALACDILIASDTARFADTHVRVGALPGWGLSQYLSRAIGFYRAKWLSLTGEYLSAVQAEAWGLVGRVVPGEHLACAARTVADELLAAPADTLLAYKRLIDDGNGTSLQEGLAIEAERCAVHNAGVSAADIAGRRAGVFAHGRTA